MSWSTWTTEPVNAEDAVTVRPELSTVQFVNEEQKAATEDQIKAAHKAVAALLKAVGRKGDQYRVTISGHANPDHAPLESWADEMITVTVAQVPAAE